ncbi:uncharacterized protein C2orf80 isoform X1 [Oryzias melastigma]|uniref:uncharacterized protein C2orf80 isoform X1 n=1 Tax=Oryzias melastigma TaxID=30732 RepID=UPI000CF7F062|nr:uncharacterized protein C2orf80 isoform X1 [Oryzias melastigma]
MEVKQLKREVKALISDYIGQKLREKSFDPAGRGVSSVLDDLAHYDLALSVAFWWLNRMDERCRLNLDMIGATSSIGRPAYPDRSEREAMILSSFAGIIMSSIPLEQILGLYSCKPAALYPSHQSQPQGAIVYPLTLSHHPFAMLASYKAVLHSRKHNRRMKKWLSERTKTSAQLLPAAASSSCSSPSEFVLRVSHPHNFSLLWGLLSNIDVVLPSAGKTSPLLSGGQQRPGGPSGFRGLSAGVKPVTILVCFV